MTIEVLTPIWERVLQRSPVLPGDDFFELGGDYQKAFSLVAEIERDTGYRLPITAFPAALSVARMAAIFGSEPKTSPLVLVRSGPADCPPFFLAHGLGGSALENFPIGRRIRWPGAIYAIQGSGLDAS